MSVSPINQSIRQIRLFDEFASMQDEDAWTAKEAGYLPSALVQASFPYRDPGNIPVFHRSSGNVSLLIEPGHGVRQEITIDKSGAEYMAPVPYSLGFPYGSIPRLVLAWITTQAINTNRCELQMGENLSHFMSLLGSHHVSGGKTGSIVRLKEQTRRLLQAHITLVAHDGANKHGGFASQSIQITSRNDTRNTIWQSDMNEQKAPNPFGSQIILSREFFEQLQANPVPLDFRALRSLRASPLALDIYAWLTWSMFRLKREKLLEWSSLYRQFGSFSSERKFRENFKHALNQVLVIYYTANVKISSAGLVLNPSPTHVPHKKAFHPVIGMTKIDDKPQNSA